MSKDLRNTLIITEIRDEVNTVRLFYLQPVASDIAYQAGQYLTFILPQNEKELRRSYSLVSSPVLGEQLCIAVKRIQNGAFSRHLYDRAKPGDKLTTAGAGGVFVLPTDISKRHTIFFFAAGTGIVPIFSLIKTALAAHPHLHVILVYSNSSRATTLFYAQLTALARDYPSRLHIEFIFSDSREISRAHLHPGLVPRFLSEHSTGNFENDLFYICGPEAYMRMISFTLRRLKVPADNIKREIFDTSKSVPRNVPPDTNPHKVSLNHGSEAYTITVQYPETILMSARRQGIVLPYSCEAGRCGNCIAKCESGKVWMSYNEVLTDRELSEGYVLTCTGFPVEGDVSIRF